jgi:hypothetical protein
MSTRNSSGREKFQEPRGWAMKWVFAQDAAPSTVKGVQEDCNGSGPREKFAEPRSWAMKWDGVALSEAERRERR